MVPRMKTTVWTIQQALGFRVQLHEQGKRLVFTNGHFDLLHIGHLDYLEKARALGDALIVGVNDDASTTRLKGVGRPITPAVERVRLLSALEPVTAAITFSGDTADNVLNTLQPDIYAKGEDYTKDTLPEYETVSGYGGEVVFIPYLPGHSTSRLIQIIQSLPQQSS